MARRLRKDFGNVLYHVLNRAAGRRVIFDDDADFLAFEKVLAQAAERVPMRILSYCLMGNHFHLVLWPRKTGDLRRFMQWLTLTHTKRWQAHRRIAGEGPLYQGRYKSFPIQPGGHLLQACRYVERNRLRAGLVQQAQDWPYCSLAKRLLEPPPAWLLPPAAWPVPLPANWLDRVNRPETEKDLETLHRSVNRGQPYGDEHWQRQTAGRLHLQSSLRDPWRPSKSGKVSAKRPASAPAAPRRKETCPP